MKSAEIPLTLVEKKEPKELKTNKQERSKITNKWNIRHVMLGSYHLKKKKKQPSNL